MTFKECYAILGLKHGAGLDEVKHAYRRRAFELHPDLNPQLEDATYKFQQLNEAYVNLLRILPASADTENKKKKDNKKEAKQDKKSEKENKTAKDSQAGEKEESTKQKEAQKSREKAEEKKQEEEYKAQKKSQDTSKDFKDSSDDRQRKTAQEAYSRHEEDLRDILNDPFARRVFEDIYSEISKKQVKDKEEQTQSVIEEKITSPKKVKKLNLEWGGKTLNLDFTNGVSGLVHNWLRRQIDDELIISLPKSRLFPGARVRLQIRKGLAKDPTVLEVTLPHDFFPGKPVRIKGMGKKIGKWTGDLYLTIEAQ